MTYDINAFNDFIIDRKIMVVSEHPFLLKSGRESHLYVNWRQASNDVYSLDLMSDFIIAFAKSQGLDVDCFFGVPEGATKLGILSTYKLAKQSPKYNFDTHCLPMGRGNIKEHGKPEDRLYIGMPVGKKTIVIEDVTTSGNSLIKCIDRLQANGVDVIAALTLTNRQEDVEGLPTVFQTRYEGKCPFYAMTNIGLLMNRFIATTKYPDLARALLEPEFPNLIAKAA